MKLGVVVVTTKDSANPVVSHIGREALRLLLALRRRNAPPAIPASEAVPADEARRLEGRYGEGDKAIDLTAPNGKLYMESAIGGRRLALRKLGPDLIVDDVLGYGAKVTPLPPAAHTRKPAPAPEAWHGLIGEYGWDHNILYILERDARLTALIEWYDSYPLTRFLPLLSASRPGLCDGETLSFRLDPAGRALEARVGASCSRAAPSARSPAIFRITPPAAGRDPTEALAASPPVESGDRAADLVALTSSIGPSGSTSATPEPTTSSAHRFTLRPGRLHAAPRGEALVRAHRKPAQQGRPAHPRRLPPLVRHQDVLGGHARRQAHFVANPAEGSAIIVAAPGSDFASAAAANRSRWSGSTTKCPSALS
jgi:hypothetical protein